AGPEYESDHLRPTPPPIATADPPSPQPPPAAFSESTLGWVLAELHPVEAFLTCIGIGGYTAQRFCTNEPAASEACDSAFGCTFDPHPAPPPRPYKVR